MGNKAKRAELRKRALSARVGRIVNVDGMELKIIAPTVKQIEAWKDGETNAGEILRTCLADPETGELIFADATDDEINECSMGLVMLCIGNVNNMMEDVSGNFRSTTTDS